MSYGYIFIWPYHGFGGLDPDHSSKTVLYCIQITNWKSHLYYMITDVLIQFFTRFVLILHFRYRQTSLLLGSAIPQHLLRNFTSILLCTNSHVCVLRSIRYLCKVSKHSQNRSTSFFLFDPSTSGHNQPTHTNCIKCFQSFWKSQFLYYCCCLIFYYLPLNTIQI